MMFALLGIFALASCEDVPAPYPIPSAGGNGIVTTGDGSFENPYTVEDALALINGGAIPSGEVYVKGIIVQLGDDDGKDMPGNSFKNATYFISDNGSTDTKFEIYRGKGLGGEDITTADYLKIGDEVIVYGTLVLFHSTPEMTQGSILVKLNEQEVKPVDLGDPILTVNLMKGQGSWTTLDKGTFTGVWYNSSQYGMVATGYKNNQNNAAESWLISPEIDLTKASEVKMMLNEAINKIDADNGGSVESQMTVWATTNDGTTWNQVTASVRPAGNSWNFQEDEFDLSAYDGKKIKLGFKYLSTTSYTGTWEIKGLNLYGKGEASIEGGTDTPTGDATGSGTASDPYNVAAALGVCQGLQESTSASASYTSDEVYVKGRVSEIGKLGTSGGLIYYISDDGTTSNQLEIYYGNYLNGAAFTSADQLTVGDEVVVNGKLKNYKGTYEFDSGSKIVSLNGETSGGDEGGGDEGGDDISTDPVDGITITYSQIASGGYGSVSLATNGYGSQAIATESTWYTFAVNKVGFTGCKICVATASNGGVIQMQGNASDASKQGFITNVTPFKPISTIKVTCRTTTSNQYAPDFHLYAGTATHPTGTAIAKPDSEPVTSGDFKIYTYTFDLSNGNYSYFTVANDTQGALYVDEIAVTTK